MKQSSNKDKKKGLQVVRTEKGRKIKAEGHKGLGLEKGEFLAEEPGEGNVS